MARKKQVDSGGAGGGEWLNTYADMVTLLLTFFIMLFSMSTIDSDKAVLLAEAMVKQFGSVPTETLVAVPAADEKEGQASPETTDEAVDLTAIFSAIKKYIAENDLSESVQVAQGDGFVFIRFMNNMLFEPNSAVLKPADREILRFVGNGIKSVQGDCKEISIHGFTASVPDNPNYPVNEWLLSSNRANAVLVYFDDVVGIDETKMTATTWGKNHPFASNLTEESRAKNRRVEILLSTEANMMAQQLDNVYEKLIE